MSAGRVLLSVVRCATAPTGYAAATRFVPARSLAGRRQEEPGDDSGKPGDPNQRADPPDASPALPDARGISLVSGSGHRSLEAEHEPLTFR
jgi:hypothetical protein